MFKIKANPTFPAKVKIRSAGGEVNELPVVFRHKRAEDVQAFFRSAAESNRPDVDCILDLVESWEADQPLSRESVLDLMQEHATAPQAIFAAYLEELTGARLGN